ncbi:MAG: hypothetical protein LH603_05340 [Pseudonocardia sp.]|nr:hypothetical protein [Pseudonocardia sp.]
MQQPDTTTGRSRHPDQAEAGRAPRPFRLGHTTGRHRVDRHRSPTLLASLLRRGSRANRWPR